MPRHAREQSVTGIYHVMLRGVNRQSIFEDDEDNVRFISLLRDLVERFDDSGQPLPYDFSLCSHSNICEIQTLQRKERNEILESVIRCGVGVRQLARLTGVSYGIIQRINEKVGQRTVT